jgi:hypothetical protein
MELLDFYKAILGLAGVAPNADGVVVATLDGDEEPVTVGGKKLRLPTREFLRNPDWDNYIAFHPMSEKPHRGESEVLKRLRSLIIFRINHTASQLLEFMTKVAADHSCHKRLGAKASEFLTLMPKAKESTMVTMGKILDQLGADNHKLIVNMYLKRPGMLKGVKYHRLCVVNFPVFDAMDDEAKTIFGVKCNVGDYGAIKALFYYLFGVIDGEPETLEAYHYGTNKMTAPYLECLMGSAFKLVKRMNHHIRLFANMDSEISLLEFDTNWESELEDLTGYSNILEALDYNTGQVTEEEKAQPAATPRQRQLGRMAADKVELARPVQPSAPAPERPMHVVPQVDVQEEWDRLQQEQVAPPSPTGVQPYRPGALNMAPPVVASPYPQPMLNYQQPVQQDPRAGWFGIPANTPAAPVAPYGAPQVMGYPQVQAPQGYPGGYPQAPLYPQQPLYPQPAGYPQQPQVMRGPDGRAIPAGYPGQGVPIPIYNR